ncbi:MAG: hypothetical protein HEQ13_17470 [Dolichospermum sp. DEX189]|jgi:hypothetical protein|nr:hypothetical protein [Dolichospermum sp. DEX189]
MSTTKEQVQSLLQQLPDDCSIEDIQYHLYVIEKVRRGLEIADKEGTISQVAVEDYCLSKAMDESMNTSLLDRNQALAYLEEE